MHQHEVPVLKMWDPVELMFAKQAADTIYL